MIVTKEKVHFYETDKMGVVHHSNYLRWFETARVEYLRRCGVSLNAMLADGVVFPITEVRLKYKNSCDFDDEIEVQAYMSSFTKAKMEFTYRVIRCRDGAVAETGFTQNVFTNTGGQIIRLGPEWYDKIKAYVDHDEPWKE